MAVALPALEVDPIEGLPQNDRGFVRTDAKMHVAGLEEVWAAGDVTAFPIKQGGLAAQQAGIAARAIAARAGAHVPVRPFQPILRAALLSGGETEYLRTTLAADTAVVADRSLWSPAGKLAAGYLGAYLAGEDPGQELLDLDPGADRDGPRDPALDLLLAAAEADASAGHLSSALDWLALAEKLNLVIPARHVELRDRWRREIDPDAPRDDAADRLGGRFATAAEAMSDLRRRVGWLRAAETRHEAEMSDHLRHLEEGMDRLESLSASTGIIPRGPARRAER